MVFALMTGGAVTFVFTWYYHRRASRRLRIEVEKLTNLNFLILHRLEDAGLLKWSHDDKGDVVGLDFDLDDELVADEQEVEDKTIH